MNLKLVEPLKNLFKDEVRELGIALNISQDFIRRHPFPGMILFLISILLFLHAFYF